MDYKEFENEIIEMVKESVGEGTRISLHTVCKNNGIKLTGLVIMNSDECISPTIYLQPFYELARKGESLQSIIEEIFLLCREQKGQFDFDVEDFQDINATKPKILYKLVNFEKNKEMLEAVPYRKWKDLAIVYYVLVSCDELGSGSILIKNEHLKYWDVVEADLFAFAEHNTPIVMKKDFKSMAEIILDFMENRVVDEDGAESLGYDETASAVRVLENNAPIRMYVMGNRQKLNGACVILYKDTLSEFAKLIDKDFYILPSSVHEAILVPDDDAVDEESLLALVREVNENNVSREEWLSDNIYKYYQCDGTVDMIS